jgi:hypothetical protein
VKKDPCLVISEVPISFGDDQESLCGKIVKRAQLCLMWDSLEMGLPARFVNVRCCRKCVDKLADELLGKKERYIYGVVPGEQEMGEVA